MAITTAKEIFEMARNGRPGMVLPYHVGVCLGEAPEKFSPATHAARLLYNEGLVTLVQRRLQVQGQQRFEYLAIWRHRPSKPSAAPVKKPIGRREKRLVFKFVTETRFDVPGEIARAWDSARST